MNKYDYIVKLAEAQGLLGTASARNVFERLDAQDTLAFGRELETVEAKLYEYKYPDIRFRDLFPVTHPGQETDDFITWTQINAQGEPVKQITDPSADLPMVSQTGEQIQTRVQWFGNAYGYSIHDLKVAARLGRPLDTSLSKAARLQHERKMELCAANGGGVTGFQSFYAQAGTTFTASTAAASPNGTAWSAASGKTPAEIVADMTRLALNVRGTSLGMYDMATNLVIPLTEHTYISSTPYVTNGFTDKTILQWFQSQYPGVNVSYWLSQAAGTALAYVKSDEVLDFAITQELAVQPPQLVNLAFKMPLHTRFAGARVRQPFAVTAMSGI